MYEDRGDIARRGHHIVVRWPEALQSPDWVRHLSAS
jgi:hypothetical protein